jgi:hypothetical protein
MDAETYAEFAALRRLVVWLAAREIIKQGQVDAALAALSDELHSLPDENPLPPGHPYQQELGRISTFTDELVQQVAFEVRRAGR